MVFIPSVDNGVDDGFFDLVDSLLDDIYRQACLIPRLAAHIGQDDYQEELENMNELSVKRAQLMERVNYVMSEAIEYRNSFDVYSYLWVQDRSEFMKQFLLYNHELTPEEIEEAGDDGVPESPPTLEQFKEQVCWCFFCNSCIVMSRNFNIVAVLFPSGRVVVVLRTRFDHVGYTCSILFKD